MRTFRHLPQFGIESLPALEEEVPDVSHVRLLQSDHHRYVTFVLLRLQWLLYLKILWLTLMFDAI